MPFSPGKCPRSQWPPQLKCASYAPERITTSKSSKSSTHYTKGLCSKRRICLYRLGTVVSRTFAAFWYFGYQSRDTSSSSEVNVSEKSDCATIMKRTKFVPTLRPMLHKRSSFTKSYRHISQPKRQKPFKNPKILAQKPSDFWNKIPVVKNII